MTKKSLISRLLIGVVFAGVSLHAGIIADITDALALTDPTQLGRLSRNGLAQDWAGGEPYPGEINAGSTFHFKTYLVNVGITPFIQIDTDGSPNVFISAYDTSYSPLAKATNWLGDDGSSGEFFGVDSLFFQVIEPINGNLIIVVNNTALANGGVGDQFHLLVEGFIDTEFTDAPAVPEPSALFLAGGGLLLLPLLGRLRSRRNRTTPVR